MAADFSEEGFTHFLHDLRKLICSDHPHLIDLFDVYSREARFGRRWMTSSLENVPRGAKVLEVGGGLMLLSAELQREGYDVTVVEPIGVGFSAFTELQKIVLTFSRQRGHAPSVLSLPIENIALDGCFDFAFSVNVMEHVGSVSKALVNVLTALRPNASYRFLCPNYLFPYEPHFNMPTLFSKNLSERFFKRRILKSAQVADPVGMWASLNWISVPMICRLVGNISGATVRFERSILGDILERVISDTTFASRRSPWVRGLAHLLVRSGLHRLFAWLPARVLPIIDCSVSLSPLPVE